MGTQLIFTVGTNPLPVWVAWYHLSTSLPQPVTVRLVHTAGTQNERKRLQAHCGNVPDNQTYEIAAGDPGQVHEEINTSLINDLPPDQTIHVHYTGGTKVMSVETVAAIDLLNELDMKTSYLDPRAGSGPTIVDWASQTLVSDARVGVTANLNRIADLNGFELGEFQHTYWDLEIGGHRTADCPAPRSLTDEQITQGSSALNHFIPEDEYHLLEYGAYAALKEALDRISQNPAHDRSNYQLFHKVYVRRSNNVNNPMIRPFELDVVAVLGYQIVVVSCTLSGEADKVKQKGMEAILRARQLGGDEARAIVLCSAHSTNQAYIEAELQDETGSLDLPLQVWGRNNWQQLSDKFFHYLQNDLHWR